MSFYITDKTWAELKVAVYYALLSLTQGQTYRHPVRNKLTYSSQLAITSHKNALDSIQFCSHYGHITRYHLVF